MQPSIIIIIIGISDGFTVDEKGQIVQLYDPTIALSCAFGYKIQTESDETAGRLNIEIERRQLDFETLLNKYKETDANALHAESMVHYIDFDLTNHVMKFIIPVEDASGTLSHGDTLPVKLLKWERSSQECTIQTWALMRLRSVDSLTKRW